MQKFPDFLATTKWWESVARILLRKSYFLSASGFSGLVKTAATIAGPKHSAKPNGTQIKPQ